ncbi:MAG: RNA polymerase sigma factor [Desulfocapsaceae bacterium]|nr:RNA polymerase sigma factor [Desulfocapsaceae bacterium]
MDAFLQSVERQAYRIALVATRHHEDALDVVQEAMLRFVEKYSKKPREAWKPLFFRILYNQITTLQRRRTVQHKWFSWLLPGKDDTNPIEARPGSRTKEPEHATRVNTAYNALENALTDLSLRQQQAFLLRGWQELSVAETATAMQCSEGSVKTHYSRALEVLRERLGDHWP